MEFFKPGIRYNFLSISKPLVSISILVVLTSWALVGIKGLNFGIDFAGGTEALLSFSEGIPEEELKAAVAETGFDSPEVVKYGINEEGKYFVRSRTQSLLTKAAKADIKVAIVAKFGEPKLWDASDESGEEIRVQFEKAQDQAAMTAVLKAKGFAEGEVSKQTEANNPIYILRIPGVRARLIAAMVAKYGQGGEGKNGKFLTIERLESVGSAVGKQMRNQGVLAVLYTLVAILLYVSFRFDLRYSPGAVAALVHDVSITVGIFAITGIEFNLPIIAALLAIVGYSLNDTIVVYDRIRESLKMGLGDSLEETINISISDSLSRTVLTSVTTFLAVLSIYIFGGGIIQNFAFAMLIGVVVGTYSSIYIASPAVMAMDKYLKSRSA